MRASDELLIPLGKSSRLQYQPRTWMMEQVLRLYPFLPHLFKTPFPTSIRKSELSIFDYKGKSLHATESISLEPEADVPVASLRRFLNDEVSNEVDLRVVLVEDFCTEIMELLGFNFGMSPDFFEEHLCRVIPDREIISDKNPRSWFTGTSSKDYASIRWARLVRIPKPSRSFDKFIAPGERSLDNNGMIVKDCDNKQQAIKPTEKHACNIWRSESGISMWPDSSLPSKPAWIERLIIWRRNSGTHVLGKIYLICSARRSTKSVSHYSP